MKRTGTWMRRMAGAAILLMSLMLLGGCGKKEKDTTDKILKTGILKVAIVDGRSGLVERTGSNYTGLEPELVVQTAASLNLRPQFIIVEEADQGYELLLDGDVDLLIGSISENSVYKEFVTSDVYAEKALYVISLRGVFSNSMASYYDKMVGMSEDVYQHRMHVFSAFSEENISCYSKTDLVVKALEAEMIAGYFCYLEDAINLAGKYDQLQAQSVLDTEMEEFVAVTIPTNRKLLDTVNEVIENGTF